MSTLSRRGLLVLGGSGAAGLALAGCGANEDPRDEGRDPELLGAAFAAEHAYGAGAKAFGDQQGISQLIFKQSSIRLDAIDMLANGNGPDIGGSSTENVNDAGDAAIVAYRELGRFGSTEEVRAVGAKFAAGVAAELAALRELENDDEVPFAFVTGLPHPPLESTSDAPPDGGTTSTTSTTSTTTEGG
jgi:hypothetical protein